MISVCVATFNGERYVAQQLQSILASPLVDEVIVSDDGSSDRTCDIVRGFHDPRLRLVDGPRNGLIRNFESLLDLVNGDHVFLSDQDDVWLPSKVDIMMEALRAFDLVVSDCRVVDHDLLELHPSFFQLRHSGPGLLRNLLRNTYLGCCMAFRRQLLSQILPFPASVPMHDWWIGLVAERVAKVGFVGVPLVLYRRHATNTSSTSRASRASFGQKLNWRLTLIRALLTKRRDHAR
jgi:glycosyltransferase involved in cell wall biosynthesis